MQVRGFCCAIAIAAVMAFGSPLPMTALGKPGVTPVPCPQQAWQPGDPAFEALPGAKAFFGQYDGGLYKIEIPDKWNGELALYAHGFVSNAGAQGSALRVGNAPIREHLIKEGYAWAASSYRCNGYVPGQGLVDTMALTDLFTKTNGGRAPQRVYLTGTSMGGHVTLLGMHEFPTSFAGALAMCPAGPELFDYFAAVSAAAEVVTGVQFKPDTLQQDAAAMAEMLGKPPEYTDKGRQLASVEIQISGGPRPFAMEGLTSRFVANLGTSQGALVGSTTPTNRAVETTHIKYAIDEGLGLTADAINSKARRKTGDPAMRNPNGPYEEIVPFDGKIERPVITMHGTGDLFVPIVLEQTLKRAVEASGKGQLLTQRVYRVAGHCGFSQPEMIKAFDDLTKWVHQGTKPEGDEVLGDLRNAGMKFTDPLRPNDPGGVTVKPISTQQASKVDFARDVQPILRQNCYGCHGPAVHQNGFRLDRRSDAMRGGTIAVIGPGASQASRMYLRLIGSEFGTQMPPTGALAPEKIRIIKDWIDQGADWPDEASGETPPAPVDPVATRLIDALRNGDRQAFKKLTATTPKAGSLRGPGGTTPLMAAALYGDPASVRALLDAGADVNARNDAGVTALMWAVTDVEKTRLLIERGADVNARSSDDRTPLLIAAGISGASPVVKLLLERGANVSVKAPGLDGETTPLLEATLSGDEATFNLLLDHGADANAAGPGPLLLSLRAECARCVERLLKATNPALLTPAMIFSGPPIGPALATPMLLDRGADAKGKDPAGRTMLMLAASSDALPVDAIKALIARGADVNAKGPNGETALMFARLRGRTSVVDVLIKAGAGTPDSTPAGAVPKPSPAASPRAAVERVLPLLQQNDVTFLKKAGCVSCHNNSLTAMTVALARGNGLRVDEDVAHSQAQAIGRYIDSWRERVLQGSGIPGDTDTLSTILLGLSAENYPADQATDAMARFIRRQQRPTGQWLIFAHRPPLESNDIQVTAVSMRALQVYAPKPDRVEYQKAIQRAAAWLTKAEAKSTEERAFQLLGLNWAAANKATIQVAARALVAEQRADGGWSQLPTLESDAYATGEALVALRQSGAIALTDTVFKRGVQFLLNSQLADGSWYVKSRAIPIQPFFESGFPHGRDQFISAAASNWAAMALALAVKPGA